MSLRRQDLLSIQLSCQRWKNLRCVESLYAWSASRVAFVVKFVASTPTQSQTMTYILTSRPKIPHTAIYTFSAGEPTGLRWARRRPLPICTGRGEGPVQPAGLAAGGVPRGALPLAQCGHRETPGRPGVLLLGGDSGEAGHEIGVPWGSPGEGLVPSRGLALPAAPLEGTGMAEWLQRKLWAAAAVAASPRGVVAYALSGSEARADLVMRRRIALLRTKLRSRKNAASSEDFRQPCVPCTRVCPPLWWISN